MAYGAEHAIDGGRRGSRLRGSQLYLRHPEKNLTKPETFLSMDNSMDIPVLC